jgi:hypothetical protein
MSGFNTYAAVFTGLNPGVAATGVIAELVCSGLQEIQVLRIVVSATALVAAAIDDILVIKESTNSTLGTKTGVLGVPFTTLNTTPATAQLNGYTVTPTAGTLVGVLATQKLGIGITATGAAAASATFDFVGLTTGGQAQLPALNLATEAIAITFNGVTPPNALSLDIYVWWQEVPLLT